jgi:hypothetical protein
MKKTRDRRTIGKGGVGISLDVLEEAARDPETGEIGDLDMNDPEVRKYVEENAPYLPEMAAQFLTSKGEILTPAAISQFLNNLISNLHTAMVVLGRRARGDYSPDQHLPTLPEYRRKSPPQPALLSSAETGNGSIITASRSVERIRRPGQVALPGASAMQLFERHIAAAKPAAGTVRRVVFATLDNYLAGRSFDALSDDEAQPWITSLVTNERNAGTVKRTWISSLKAVARWAVKRRLIATNPYADCSVLVPKQARHRETKAFTTEEQHLILSHASAIKDVSTATGAARRWVFWICAYTGARAGEITQLRGQDVIERDGIWRWGGRHCASHRSSFIGAFGSAICHRESSRCRHEYRY